MVGRCLGSGWSSVYAGNPKNWALISAKECHSRVCGLPSECEDKEAESSFSSCPLVWAVTRRHTDVYCDVFCLNNAIKKTSHRGAQRLEFELVTDSVKPTAKISHCILQNSGLPSSVPSFLSAYFNR